MAVDYRLNISFAFLDFTDSKKLADKCLSNPIKCAKEIGCAPCSAAKIVKKAYEKLIEKGATLHPCFTFEQALDNKVVNAISGFLEQLERIMDIIIRQTCLTAFPLFQPIANSLGLKRKEFCQFGDAIASAISNLLSPIIEPFENLLPDTDFDLAEIPKLDELQEKAQALMDILPNVPGWNPLDCASKGGEALSECIIHLFDGIMTEDAIKYVTQPKWNTLGFGGFYLNWHLPNADDVSSEP